MNDVKRTCRHIKLSVKKNTFCYLTSTLSGAEIHGEGGRVAPHFELAEDDYERPVFERLTNINFS